MKSHPDAPVSIFGHADPVGNDDYNKKLSGRRAMAVYGILTRNADIWEELYSNPLGNDDWKVRTVKIALKTVGYSPGPVDDKTLDDATREALRKFQHKQGLPENGDDNSDTRARLFMAYMDTICRDADGQPFKLSGERGKGCRGHTLHREARGGPIHKREARHRWHPKLCPLR